MLILLKNLSSPEVSGAILRQYADDTAIGRLFDALDLPPADELPCPAPGGDGCPRQVREMPDGTFVAVCGRYPQKCSDVHPDSVDRTIYGVNLKRVAATIADSFKDYGVTKDIKTINEDLHLVRVGFYNSRGSLKYPILFHLPFQEGDRQKASELLIGQNAPFILLLPSISALKQESIASLRNHRSVITGLTDFTGSNGEIDSNAFKSLLSDFLSLQPESKEAEQINKFATPPGTEWKDITITFIERDIISIKCGEAVAVNYERLHVPSMFSAKNRDKKPTKKWYLLMAFALWGPNLKREDLRKLFGHNDWEKMRAQKSGLSKSLKEFFGIDTDPIEFDENTNEYKPLLFIRQDSNCHLTNWIADIHK